MCLGKTAAFLLFVSACTPVATTRAASPLKPTPVAGSGALFPHLQSTAVEAGSECPAGGVRIETWNSPAAVSSAFNAETDRDRTVQVLCAGTSGAAGTAGAKGDTGVDGVSVGVASSAVLVGDMDCAQGGQKYETWRDVNNNGTYESGVDTGYVSKKICHGLSGAASGAGANAVVITTALPVGNANCLAGGVQVEAFTDMDGDGSYTSGTDIHYSSRLVCNGAGAVVLTTTIPADGSDTTCRNGGTLFRTFTDGNGNGVYDAAIDTNKVDTKVCNSLQALVKTSAVALNDATCPAGGTLVESCTDSDQSGTCVSGTDSHYLAQKICAGSGAGLTLATEPAGVNCRNGGQKVTRFSDANGNDTMDAGAETTGATVSYVCNGLNWISKSTVFAAGAAGADGTACPSGGYRLEFGYDNVKASDGSYLAGTSGVLDVAEVVAAATSYSCNGAKAIVTTSVLAGSDTCPAGGVTLTSCTDGSTDGSANGACDGGENPVATTACNTPKLLVRTSAEVAGANCTYGGNKLEFGYDHVCATASGACASAGKFYAGVSDSLDDLEVIAAQIKYACKGDTGAQGAQGYGVVMVESAEAPGANCTAGGKKIDFYQDPNNNGVRDAGENTLLGTSQYVCHGVGTGYTITTESVGANCLTGGQKIVMWQDKNGNATYEAGTDGASSTQYVCNGTGASNEPSAGPYIAQLQNDSEGAAARFYWQVTSTLGAAAPTVKLAYAPTRGALEAWACESAGTAPTNVTVVENYSSCDATYAAATVPFATATTGVLGAQGKCGVSLATLNKWDARYFKLCAQETATPTNYSLSAFRVAGYVPPGMVMVHKDDWPTAEFAGSNVQPFTYAIDKYEGYKSSGTLTNGTPTTCTATNCVSSSTAVVKSAANQAPLVSIDWYAFKQGCNLRTADAELTGFADAAGDVKRKAHLATDMEWFVAAAGTPDVSGTNYCNTGTAAVFNSGTANTQYCKSRYGAENMIGNVWEWTDSYWNFVPTPRTRSEYFGTTSEATTPLSDAVLGYVFPTTQYVAQWDYRYLIPKLTQPTSGNIDFSLDHFWLAATAQRASLRGGFWNDGTGAGRFALRLDFAPTGVSVSIGGRCALSPP